MQRPTRGYSLPELSIVLVIGSVFTLGAVPALIDSVQQTQVRLQTQSVQALLDRARMLALRHGSAQVCSGDAQGCRQQWSGDTLRLEMQAEGSSSRQLIQLLPLNGVRAFWKDSGGKKPVQFASGGAFGSNGTFYLCPGGGVQPMSIVINAGGRTRIEPCGNGCKKCSVSTP
ncbi:MAG: GspH/FimT family protein [Gammaproteobacteria bacterium AqS3]|nr:GspH/FimT family protein [Gammaproteobacteria bacterium AqS3]